MQMICLRTVFSIETRKMFKFSNSFVCVASVLVFVVVVCDGLSALQTKGGGGGRGEGGGEGGDVRTPVKPTSAAAAVKLTKAERKEVVDRHNYYRRKEGASNMKKMRWNQHLADMASEWVSGCVFEHGQPPRDEDDLPFEKIGQNLCISTRRDRDLIECTDLYYAEKKDFNYGSNSCKAKAKCGHYTQVVWSDSTDVGCAAAQCNFGGRLAWYHACNYGPAGNYVGKKPYKKGLPCSKCPGHHVCEKGLCK